MSFKLAEVTLASSVASAGTFTVPYPDGTAAGTYAGGNKHVAWVDTHQYLYTVAAGEISLSFGASEITVTYNGSTTIAAGSRVHLQLDILGSNDLVPGAYELPIATMPVDVFMMDLGAPITADPDGVAEAQNVAEDAEFTLNGAQVTGGVAILDVPRNVTVDSGGADTAVVRVTGTDVYGNVMVEDITLNGTTLVAGKKAFKTVTSAVATGAAVANSAFIGFADVLGLPAYVASAAQVLAELEDGAAATAGTLVTGVNTTPTATTGDVRGTYDPNSAADGSKAFKLLIVLPDPSNRGVDQFDG